MSASTEWSAWRDWLAAGATEATALRRRLDALVAPVSALLGPGRDQWHALDVELLEAPLGTSGGCQDDRGSRRIFINAEESHLRKRFTAVHELAHLLLMDERIAASGVLDPRTEERFCDGFASAVLVPRQRLRAILAERGLPRDPVAVLSLCGAFRVNITPMMIALRPFFASAPWTIVPARRRGHRHRLGEVDFRVECFTGHRGVFIPPEQRLASLGLESLVSWARVAARGTSAKGVDRTWLDDDLNDIEADRPPVRWSGHLLGGEPELLLAVFELTPLLVARAERRSQSLPQGGERPLAAA
jgi:hypothetical protein